MAIKPYFLLILVYLSGCVSTKIEETPQREVAELSGPKLDDQCASDVKKITANFTANAPKQLATQIEGALKEFGFFSEANDPDFIAEISTNLFGDPKKRISKFERKEFKKIFEFFVLALKKKKSEINAPDSPSIMDLSSRLRETLDWLNEVQAGTTQPLVESTIDGNWLTGILFLKPDSLESVYETFEQTVAFKTLGIFSLRKDQIFISAQITGADLTVQNLLFDSKGPFNAARTRVFSKLPSKSEHKKFLDTFQKELESVTRSVDELKRGSNSTIPNGYDQILFSLNSKIENVEKALARAFHLAALYPKPKYTEIFQPGKDQIIELGKTGEELCQAYTQFLVDILKNASKIREAWGPENSANHQAISSFLDSVPSKIERIGKLKEYFSPLLFVR